MAHEMTWVECHPTEDILAIGTARAGVVLWNSRKGTLLRRIPNDDWIVSARWSPDGGTLAVAGVAGRVGFLDRQGEPRSSIDTGHETLSATAFDSSGTHFATCGNARFARVWNATAEFEEAYRIEPTNAPAVHAVGFAGDTLLVGFESGFFQAWIDRGRDWVAGGELFGRGRVASIGVHPKLGVAMFGGGAGKIAALRTTDPWETIQVLPVPPRPIAVNQIAFSPDGARFVAACSDDAARVFTWPQPSPYGAEAGNPFHERSPKPEWSRDMIVASACFDRDRPLLYTAHFDGSVNVWDVRRHPRKLLSLHIDDAGGCRLTNQAGRTEIAGAAPELWESALGALKRSRRKS